MELRNFSWILVCRATNVSKNYNHNNNNKKKKHTEKGLYDIDGFRLFMKLLQKVFLEFSLTLRRILISCHVFNAQFNIVTFQHFFSSLLFV